MIPKYLANIAASIILTLIPFNDCKSMLISSMLEFDKSNPICSNLKIVTLLRLHLSKSIFLKWHYVIYDSSRVHSLNIKLSTLTS